MYNLRNRSFLKEIDFRPDELLYLLRLSEALKTAKYAGFEAKRLEGKEIALIFEKTSTRTRSAFEVAAFDQGAHVTYLDPSGSQLGHKESVADTARVLGRQVAAVVWRTYQQERLEQMAQFGGVPVVNALTDLFHPCQVLADLATVALHRGGVGRLAGLTLAYVGDGANNMAHSYLLGGATAGLHVRVGTPDGYPPHPVFVADAAALAERTGGSVQVVHTIEEAVEGADAVATDTWVSMGQEDEAGERETPFVPFRVDAAAMALAAPDALVLHCLPAYRGKEITAEVLDGPQAVVWDEAEFRLHAQKALLTWLLEKS